MQVFILLKSRDSKVILAKKETQDLLDQKAVLLNYFYYIIVSFNNLGSLISILDKGETGVIGLQGQKGDTVSNCQNISRQSNSYHRCAFLSFIRVLLV
jgi:hypothetical protein